MANAIYRRNFVAFNWIKGRINFLQLSRNGYMTERSHRNQFEKPFDFINFITHLIKTSTSKNCIIDFDPTFISKSGKRTPGLGFFYSGCAGSYKKGLELGVVSVIDVKQNTAYHLEAIQSPALTKKERKMEGKSLIDHYASILISHAATILSISKILVVDAYFTGEKMALVGENGSGKTTLVKLIARMYDPSEGTIYLDDIDIKKYTLESYRRMIGVIFQDYVRFNFKAGENIAIGKIEAAHEAAQIISSAHLSLADTVIQQLPAKYQQMLGKRFADGVDLSGGEWQKIALARAYMRDASIVILDEPTASLDARAEYEVFKRFSELTSGKTAVIISHRFSTVRMADRILVLKRGQFVELGSHEDLLANKGLYFELFTLQAQGYL